MTFHFSIAETWNNVLHLQSDVKELIPEFYQPEMADFLINRTGLNLGIQQDGSKVNRVELPPWAEGKATSKLGNMATAECSHHCN